MQKTILQFSSMPKRFWGLRKFKKEHPDMVVTKKGFATTGCGRSYYFAHVEYGC